MAQAIFPDNTVLCNFAAVRRLDLLEAWLRGRGRWTEAVAFEARRSEDWWPELAVVRVAGWLGEPIELTDPGEVEAVERIRRVVFGGSPSQARKHLGEAQTCFLLLARVELAGSWWLSDDAEAFEYAVRRGIQAYRTIDVVSHIIADGDLPLNTGFRLLHAMSDQGRKLDLPSRPSDLT